MGVLLALGAALVALVLHNKSEVGFQISAGPAAPGIHATSSSSSSSSSASEQPAAPRARPTEPPARAPAPPRPGSVDR